MEFSSSDYHHITKPPMRRSSTQVSLQGHGHVCSKSRYSIVEDNRRRPSYASGRQPSEAETEKTYDPFRSSRPQMPNTLADHARITVLRGQSNSSRSHRAASGTPSFRMPSLGRVKSGAVYSISSSPPPVPTDANGKPLTLRRSNMVRNFSRSSVASSRRLYRAGGSGGVRTSMSYKRGVSFNHAQNRSGSAAMSIVPPLRTSRAPEPPTLQERYINDDQWMSVSSESSANNSSSPAPINIPPVRSRKEKSIRSIAEEIAARKSKRASLYWKEEARKVSSELENLCDEAFNPPFVPVEPPTITEVEEVPHSIRRASPTIPIANESRFASSSIVRPRNGTPSEEDRDRYRQRPLPRPPLNEHIETKAKDELTRARELLLRRAADLTPGALDEVIAQIDRLMQASNLGITDQEYERRVASAPVGRSLDPRFLSPVKEVSETPRGRGVARFGDQDRAVSTPTTTRRTELAHLATRAGFEDRSTVRLVDYSLVPRPAPLVIRKRSGEATITEKVVQRAASHDSLSKSYAIHENSDLTRDFPNNNVTTRSQSRLGHHNDRRSAGSAALDPIFEDENKGNNDPLGAKRLSAESRKKGWFSRRFIGRSLDSDEVPPPPPLKDDWTMQDFCKRNSAGENRVSDIPSEESRYSDSKLEKSSRGKFFKIFSKRDTKVSRASSELALTGKFSPLDNSLSTPKNNSDPQPPQAETSTPPASLLPAPPLRT